MKAWTQGFTALHPDTPARVKLYAKFSADFVAALGHGEISVAPFARELFSIERVQLTKQCGGAPRMVPVATGSRATKGGTHAIVIFVNEENPLTHLSLPQLLEIFAADGRITTWGQLGLKGEWANRKISLYGMKVRRETGNPPGIVNFLEARLLKGHHWREDLHESNDVPGGPQALELITKAVAADESALGYSGFAYAVPRAKALALGQTDAGPFYVGTEVEIARHEYPLARTIYLCTGPSPDAATCEFVRYVLSPAGQSVIAADQQKFFPLAASRERPAYEPRAVELPRGKPYVRRDGSISIVGYNDMDEMLAALNARFTVDHPEFKFISVLRGTRTAPPALARQESAFAPMGAEFSTRELHDYRAATGGEPRLFRVAHCSLNLRALSGPLAIIVHRDNPLQSLTLDEARDIFSGRATRGLHLYGLGVETALGIFLQQRILGGSDFSTGFRGQPQSSDVVKLVASDHQAIGFAAAMRATPGVKILALAEHQGMRSVALSEDHLREGSYPLDRFLLLYVREPLEPWIRDYLCMVLSAEGQGIIAGGSLGYLPLNTAEILAERTKLD